MCEVRAGSRNVQVWSGRWEVRLGEAEQYWLWCPITTRFHHGNGRYDSPTRRVDLTGNSPKLEEWLFHTEMVGCGVWNEDRLSPTLQVTDRVNCWPPTGVFKPDSISVFSAQFTRSICSPRESAVRKNTLYFYSHSTGYFHCLLSSIMFYYGFKRCILYDMLLLYWLQSSLGVSGIGANILLRYENPQMLRPMLMTHCVGISCEHPPAYLNHL